MINLGILSAYSAYTGQTNSAYGSTTVSAVENKQDSSDEKKSNDISSTDEINDEAIISDEAKSLAAADKGDNTEKIQTKDKPEESKNNDKPKFDKKLTTEEEQDVAKLKARDAEVKAHEQAHMAAAAGISASAPTYDYQTGPDGQKYAVGGEVSISFVQGNDPEENISNAETMKAAALAPAQPSTQDMSVARNADKIIEEEKKKQVEQQAQEVVNNTKFNTYAQSIVNP